MMNLADFADIEDKIPDNTFDLEGDYMEIIGPAHPEFKFKCSNDQPAPVHNDKPAVWPLVMKDVKDEDILKDMKERHEVGIARYGTPLQPWNGRNAIVDAYQELLDLIVYLKQATIEQPTNFKLLYLYSTFLQNLRTLKDLTQQER